MPTRRRRLAAPFAALGASCVLSPAVAAPEIVAIEFSGNNVTREPTMLREMALGVGDPADDERIEDSRQGIQDLGLFREVDVERVDRDDGVALRVNVRERRYILPVPRLDFSSDLDRSAGLSLRLNNLWGRNHTLSALVQAGRYPEDRLREKERRARLSYEAPHVFDDVWGFAAGIERLEREVPGVNDAPNFDEDIDRAEFLVTRDFRDVRPRRGWVGKAGLFREERRNEGIAAPESDGTSIAMVLGADYDNRRDHTYSDTGRSGGVRMEWAEDLLLSDFSYRKIDVEYREMLALPGDHHNLNLIAAGGLYNGGTNRRNTYDLGGSTRLRGYGSDYIQGERFAYGAAEYLRPLGLDWLRLLVVAEAGATDGIVAEARSGGPYASIGVGLRVRLTWFVNLEFEAGFAYPLRGGGGPRFFASGE